MATITGSKSSESRKAKGRRRGEAAVAGFDPFQYLLQRAIKARSTETKTKLAIELLPYVKPKLKSVDVVMDQNVEVTITIGGPDTEDNQGQHTIEHEATPIGLDAVKTEV